MKTLVVCGATATGKSDLAFEIAKRLKAEIINFDSIQFYKDFNIGAAKPPQSYLDQIPHHFVGVVDPTINYTAGDFRRDSLKLLKSLEKKQWTVLVGGTGFYLQALIRGMYGSSPSDPKIKKELIERRNQEGLENLYFELKKKDPAAAEKIHPNDEYRVLRALEIINSQSKTLSEIRSKFVTEAFPYEAIHIGLRRKKEVLAKSIRERSEQMIEQGVIEEVRFLIKKYGSEIKPLKSVGYREVCEFLEQGEKNIEDLVGKITQSTLKLAKRQSTWFKRDSGILWLDPDEGCLIERAWEIIDKKP